MEDNLRKILQLIGNDANGFSKKGIRFTHLLTSADIEIILIFHSVVAGAKLDAGLVKELQSIQSYLQTSGVSIETLLNDHHFVGTSSTTSTATNWNYAAGVLCLLVLIDDELAKSDEYPLAVGDSKKIFVGLRKAIAFGIRPYLAASSPTCLICSVSVLVKIVASKHFLTFCSKAEQKLIHRDIVSALFCLLASNEPQIERFNVILSELTTKLPHSQYFEILFLIKGDNELPPQVHPIAHKQLLQCLYRSGSFIAICEALIPDALAEDEESEEIAKKRWHCCNVISSIVGRRGYSRQFYHMIIDEIHQHLLQYLDNERPCQDFFADVAVQVLSKLYSLELNFIRLHIVAVIFGQLQKLAEPDVIIAGAIVFEETEMFVAVQLIYLAFCATGPSDVTLSSNLLVPYLPILLQLHNVCNELICPRAAIMKKELTALIVRCLVNREKSELNGIVETILYDNYDDKFKRLHPRIQIIGDTERFVVKISNSTVKHNDSGLHGMESFHQSSIGLVNLLKVSDNNLLVYNVFLHLLQMFAENFGGGSTAIGKSAELMDDVDELAVAIEGNFKRKYVVINALNELIQFKPFHSQFNENPHYLVAILHSILNRHIESHRVVGSDSEEFLMVILSIVGEFLHKIRNEELKSKLHRTLKRLKTLHLSSMVARKLNTILEPQTDSTQSEYAFAYSLLNEPQGEPYRKVQGIMSLLKLIKGRDDEAVLNAHSILALAMKMLREEDSYIFLNCIKLLIGLTEMLEDTVIDALIAEYHCDVDDAETNIDFKLKIGETIVKVTQGLGEMCFKYKDALISCYLRGICHKNAEFRTSNIANLGMILRALAYQIHNFFEEVNDLNSNCEIRFFNLFVYISDADSHQTHIGTR